MSPRGRPTIVPAGETHHFAKLTRAKVNEIREIRATMPDVTYGELAKTYGVTAGNICAVVRGETWPDPAYVPPARRVGWCYNWVTPEQATEIRAEYVTGPSSMRDLAAKHQLAPHTVQRIVAGKSGRSW